VVCGEELRDRRKEGGVLNQEPHDRLGVRRNTRSSFKTSRPFGPSSSFEPFPATWSRCALGAILAGLPRFPRRSLASGEHLGTV